MSTRKLTPNAFFRRAGSGCRRFAHACVTTALLAHLAGCSVARGPDAKLPFVYRIDIQQGNLVTQEMLAKLQPGMEKSKVRFIMGTPLLVDSFHTDRWDYLYSFQEGGGRREQRQVSLLFEDDKLVAIDGDVLAAPGRLEVKPKPGQMVEVPGKSRQGLIGFIGETVGFGDDEFAPKDEAAEKAEDEPLTVAEQDAEETLTIPEDAPRPRKKGLFGRLLNSVGLGDDEDARYQPVNPPLTDTEEP